MRPSISHDRNLLIKRLYNYRKQLPLVFPFLTNIQIKPIGLFAVSPSLGPLLQIENAMGKKVSARPCLATTFRQTLIRHLSFYLRNLLSQFNPTMVLRPTRIPSGARFQRGKEDQVRLNANLMKCIECICHAFRGPNNGPKRENVGQWGVRRAADLRGTINGFVAAKSCANFRRRMPFLFLIF